MSNELAAVATFLHSLHCVDHYIMFKLSTKKTSHNPAAPAPQSSLLPGCYLRKSTRYPSPALSWFLFPPRPNVPDDTRTSVRVRFAWAWFYDVIDYDCAPSELHIPRTLSHSTHDPIRGDSQKSRHHLRRKDCISFSSSDLISHFLMMHVSHNINISIIIPMCYVFSTFNHRHVF